MMIRRVARATTLAVILFLLSIGIYVIASESYPPDSPRIYSAQEVSNIIKPLSWTAPEQNFELSAAAAILIDEASGSILYAKNPDRHIPPASMTKLVTLYVAYKAAAAGEISLTDTVTLPPESWLRNLPPRSSGMCLEKGQVVTVEELMRGMAVASGNDAAIALAYHIAGSVEAFCTRMNNETEKLGLTVTHFVEPSGLSEQNTTTAAEFAKFCRHYITTYPQSLKTLHSVRSMTYPLKRNMPPDGSGTFFNITQHNTNKLLSTLNGCDGLKTGYIDESGYNLALTVKRDNMRILAIIMGCPGNTTAEGNKNRASDSKKLTDYAYRYFESVALTPVDPIPLPVIGGCNKERFVFAVEKTTPVFCVPVNSANAITRTVTYDRILTAPITKGSPLGSVVYHMVNDTEVCSTILVADRDITKGSAIRQFYDFFYGLYLKTCAHN